MSRLAQLWDHASMPYVLNQDHIARAFASGRITTAGRPAATKVVHAGDLIVSSQAIAACRVCQLVTDFLLFYEDPPASEPPKTKPWWRIWRR